MYTIRVTFCGRWVFFFSPEKLDIVYFFFITKSKCTIFFLYFLSLFFVRDKEQRPNSVLSLDDRLVGGRYTRHVSNGLSY